MKKEEIEKIVKLRENIISYYNTLDGNEISSIVKQADVAFSLERIISDIDNILKPYVNFR
tara:strand:+ start:1464 stop:1643 length:180 start_codon:yes stop_codon:yes gene_type:complete